MPASYPTSAKSFTTKNTGDSIQADHVNDLQLEVTAVEADLLAGLPVSRGGTGRTTLTANAVLYGNGTSQVALAVIGSEGQVLRVMSGVPAFADIAGDDQQVVLAAQIFG